MDTEIKELIGKTLRSVTNNNDLELIFNCIDDTKYKMYHCQDCCESVVIDDISGDLSDLIGNPILVAEERTSGGTDTDGYESVTWTFYTLRTVKGTVDIKWIGESNGYYSEDVSFCKLKSK